ncbi:hypothetical protein [Lysobacter sp. Root667]|uniref:hypothetical protein n=1 Tax=Lysobacter sp. Root667 TaxID=1736581 RepID=UPI0012DF8575|nr:hypothetical protein [Lysobacter sp. Root667]
MIAIDRFGDAFAQARALVLDLPAPTLRPLDSVFVFRIGKSIVDLNVPIDQLELAQLWRIRGTRRVAQQPVGQTSAGAIG